MRRITKPPTLSHPVIEFRNETREKIDEKRWMGRENILRSGSLGPNLPQTPQLELYTAVGCLWNHFV